MPDSSITHDVVETAEAYYRAMVAGDEEGMRRLFDSRAAVVGHFEGEFLWQDLDAFVAEARSFVGKHGREECRIDDVRVDGDIAFVLLAGRYAELWIVDHLEMVKVSGRWRITNKTYHVTG